MPGQSATINFTLKPGEPFGGALKVRQAAWERDAGGGKASHLLKVTGPNADEIVGVENGGKFELTLPPGAYTVELDRGGNKLSWPGLKTGRTDHLLEEPPFKFTPEEAGVGFDQMWRSMDRHYSYFTLKPDVDWAKLRDEYRPKAVSAKSADELASVLKEMLGRLKDGHVWIEMPDGKVVGTHRNPGPVEVGETGLTVYFSRWVDLLPDGSPVEGKGCRRRSRWRCRRGRTRAPTRRWRRGSRYSGRRLRARGDRTVGNWARGREPDSHQVRPGPGGDRQ